MCHTSRNMPHTSTSQARINRIVSDMMRGNTSHITHINGSCHTHRWVMSYMSIRHATHIHELCHTHDGVKREQVAWLMTWYKGTRVMWHISMWHTWRKMPHTWMTSSGSQSSGWCHDAREHESCHTHQWVKGLRVMWHTSMSHVTHINESCHTHQWVTSHISMSHITLINESCHTYIKDSSCDTYQERLSRFKRFWCCTIWKMRHIIYQRVMSHLNESCDTWISHVTYEWVVSHLNESCHMWMSHLL